MFVCQWPLVMSRVASELLKFFVGNQTSQGPSQTLPQASSLVPQGTTQGARTATSKPIPVAEAHQSQPRADRANKVRGSNDSLSALPPRRAGIGNAAAEHRKPLILCR